MLTELAAILRELLDYQRKKKTFFMRNACLAFSWGKIESEVRKKLNAGKASSWLI